MFETRFIFVVGSVYPSKTFKLGVSSPTSIPSLFGMYLT